MKISFHFEWVTPQAKTKAGGQSQPPEPSLRVALPSPLLTTEQHENKDCRGCEHPKGLVFI